MKTVEINPQKWTVEERQEFLDKGFRARRVDELPCTVFTRPVDYAHDLERGAIEYMPDWFNYSLHTVAIPDGATLRECNFSQWKPGTAAITGNNLTFEDCNLTNCLIDPSWVLNRCNTAQAWLVEVDDGQGGVIEKREYICDHPDKLADVKPIEPDNSVKTRAF